MRRSLVRAIRRSPFLAILLQLLLAGVAAAASGGGDFPAR